MMGRRLLALAVATLALLAACGAVEVPTVDQLRSTDHLVSQPPTTGQYVADSGFRPDPDGFSFPNYGDQPGVVQLGSSQVAQLFGEDVCLSASGAVCRLSSPATSWVQAVNNAAAGGHCEGMAALSQVFATGVQSPDNYGGQTPYALPFDDNAPLQRDIALWFTTQFTQPTSGSETRGATPVEVLDTLIETLPQERTPENTYTLGIFQPEFAGGHAITPYAVEDRGDGIFWIMVYDNNFPGQARAIAVDKESNVWSYLASTNPDAQESIYVGTAETATLTLTPLAPRLQTQECPFCAGEVDSEEGEGTNQFFLTGQGSLEQSTDFFITDSADQRLGRVDGVLVRDVPDGEILPLAQGVGQAPAPVLGAPAGFDATAVISTEQANTDLDFALIGAGYDVLVEGINSPAGGTTSVQLSADGSRVRYSQVLRSGPELSVAVENSAGYSIDLTVDMVEFDAEGATLELASKDDDANAQFSATVGGTYSLRFDVFGPDDSERSLAVEQFRLTEGQQVLLALEDYDGQGELDVLVLDAEGQAIARLPVVETTAPVPRVL